MARSFPVSVAYVPREFAVRPQLRYRGWRIKRYYVRHKGARLDAAAFSGAERLCVADLPMPARVAGRAGAAFTIAHQGITMRYFVLGWWDNENELPTRLWVCERNERADWRRARGSEGLCVWDLDIVWFERRMYVSHMMADPKAPDVHAYLSAFHGRAMSLHSMLKSDRYGA